MPTKEHGPAFGGMNWALGITGFVFLMTLLSWRELGLPFSAGTKNWTLLSGEATSIVFIILMFRVSKGYLERLALTLCITEFLLSGFGQLVGLSQHGIHIIRISKLVIWLIALSLCVGLLYKERRRKMITDTRS